MAKRTLGPSTSLSCGCMVGHELQSPYFPIRHCPLHAAAPELLAALKKAIARHTDFAWAPWTDEARAAIAKAEFTT